MKLKHDLTGSTFGRLTVVGFDPSKRCSGKSYWRCVCECGQHSSVSANNLKMGRVKSCGCVKPGNRTHGMSSMPEYRVWKGMKARCERPTSQDWNLYGGRGIRVCERWSSFPLFLEDMGERPSKDHSIERDDVHGDYCPGNCRWATKTEQARNKRTSVRVVYRGAQRTYAELSEIGGISADTIRSRHMRYGWPIEVAVSLPVGANPRSTPIGADSYKRAKVHK